MKSQQEHYKKNHSIPQDRSVSTVPAQGVVSEILGDGLIVFWNSPDTASSLRSLTVNQFFLREKVLNMKDPTERS